MERYGNTYLGSTESFPYQSIPTLLYEGITLSKWPSKVKCRKVDYFLTRKSVWKGMETPFGGPLSHFHTSPYPLLYTRQSHLANDELK